MFGIGISFRKHAGLVTISVDAGRFIRWVSGHRIWNGFCVHFWVQKDLSQWGYTSDWYDGPIGYFGLGRLLLISWM